MIIGEEIGAGREVNLLYRFINGKYAVLKCRKYKC